MMFGRAARRMFSATASHAEHEKTMKQWKNISFISVGALLPLYSVYTAWAHFRHHHGGAVPDYEHLDIHRRNSQHHKAFPWMNKESTLFTTTRHYVGGEEEHH
jgi:hypothetical protein